MRHFDDDDDDLADVGIRHHGHFRRLFSSGADFDFEFDAADDLCRHDVGEPRGSSDADAHSIPRHFHHGKQRSRCRRRHRHRRPPEDGLFFDGRRRGRSSGRRIYAQ